MMKDIYKERTLSNIGAPTITYNFKSNEHESEEAITLEKEFEEKCFPFMCHNCPYLYRCFDWRYGIYE